MKLLIEKNVPTDPSKWSYYKSQAKKKFDVYPCVPLDSLAVTKDGLKSYDELEVGEDILTYNLEKDNLEWSPIKNIHYFEDAPLMEIKKATGFRFRCTPNHKWVIRRDENRTPELVEAKDITTHMRIVFSSTMQNDTDLNLINENWGKHDSWVEKIVRMSTQQREIWLSSAIVYDGWEKGKSTKAVGRRTFGFSQKNRDHLLATIYAAYLNGYYVSVNDFDNDVVSVTIIRGKKTHGSQNVIKTQLGERENVWCPETDNKTWVMMQNGWFTITGNSAYANAWAAKQYKDAGGGWKTEEGVVNEAKNEPPVITQLRDVIRSGYKSVKDPKTGKQMKVDSYSASAIIAVYDQLKKQENRDQFVNAGLMKMQTVAFKLLNMQEGVIKENNVEDVIKDLDKVKGDLLKKVDVLVAKKKKLYSNVDIESPMSAEEKKLDKDIADLFSQIQQLVLQKRKMKKESVNEGNAFTGALFKARKEGLKEFEFGGKKYPVINEVDDDDEPSVSSVKKAGNGVEKQKREILSIQKKLKDNGKKTAEFVKIPQDDRTPAQKATVATI